MPIPYPTTLILRGLESSRIVSVIGKYFYKLSFSKFKYIFIRLSNITIKDRMTYNKSQIISRCTKILFCDSDYFKIPLWYCHISKQI